MKKQNKHSNILRYINILIVTMSLFVAQTVAAHVFTAVNMSNEEIIW